ncbi:hypothetical protein CPI04_04465, partial [Moraxella catarrhalis]|nr:hypothetical protein [Moraxella catarrhalis]
LCPRQLHPNALVPPHAKGLEPCHVIFGVERRVSSGGEEAFRDEGVGGAEVVGLAVCGVLGVGYVGLWRVLATKLDILTRGLI